MEISCRGFTLRKQQSHVGSRIHINKRMPPRQEKKTEKFFCFLAAAQKCASEMAANLNEVSIESVKATGRVCRWCHRLCKDLCKFSRLSDQKIKRIRPDVDFFRMLTVPVHGTPALECFLYNFEGQTEGNFHYHSLRHLKAVRWLLLAMASGN